MIDICTELHQCLNQLPRHLYPIEMMNIPKNGIYIFFEKGEKAHGTDRIVRIGTHTGHDKLRSRIKEHFINENKDRSIFRKNIGRAILNKNKDPFLEQWDLDLTSHEARDLYSKRIDHEKLMEIERDVSDYMRSHFSFVAFDVSNKEDRKRLESRIISTVSLCPSCRSSPNWLGSFSPKKKIRESGLWLVNELYKQPLSPTEFEELLKLITKLMQ